MKNLLYLFILIYTVTLNAQIENNPPPPPSITIPMADWNYDEDYQDYCYVKDTENKYGFWEGTWQYTNGNTSFTIVFTKYEMVYSETQNTLTSMTKAYGDELKGGYQYVENDVDICNTLNYSYPGDSYYYLGPISASTSNYNINNSLNIFYIDECENSEGIARLELLPGSTTQAQWTLTRIEPYDDNYSVPNSVILTKIN